MYTKVLNHVFYSSKIQHEIQSLVLTKVAITARNTGVLKPL